jgi:hypothetical protein
MLHVTLTADRTKNPVIQYRPYDVRVQHVLNALYYGTYCNTTNGAPIMVLKYGNRTVWNESSEKLSRISSTKYAILPCFLCAPFPPSHNVFAFCFEPYYY